jgi:hypothetical protein
MRRPQFSLKTLLWLMALVAALFGGMQVDRAIMDQERESIRIHEEAVREYEHRLDQRDLQTGRAKMVPLDPDWLKAHLPQAPRPSATQE